MSEILNLILPMPPSNINHMYNRGKSGGIYKNPAIAEWELVCRGKVKNKSRLDVKEHYSVNIGLYHGNKRKNDIDSKLKIILDFLMHEGVFADDSLVSDLIVAKRFDRENPRIEISVY